MNVLGLIPARGGSTRIPRKNLVELGGKTLLEYALSSAKEAESLHRVAVSTEDDEIAEVARRLGADVPFRRPADLALNETPALPVMQHAVNELERAEGWKADVVVFLQPTSPFRRGRHIDAAVRLLIESDAETVVTVVEVPHRFRTEKLMRIQDGWLIGNDSDSAAAEPAVVARNGPAVLAVTYEAVIRSTDLYQGKVKPLLMGPLESVDVDTRDDLKLAEALLPFMS